MSRRSKALGRTRLALLYLFVAAVIVLARPTPLTLACGAGLALAGEGVRLWAAGHLDKSVRLATGGPYARTRNPLYLGRLLILTGLLVAARHEAYLNLLGLAAGYAVFFLYYMPRKQRVEGERLARLHGPEYEAYRRAVPALFPALRPYPGALGRWSYGRMVRNQEPLVLLGLLLALGVLALKTSQP